MSRSTPAPAWDEASSPEAAAAARRFVDAWRARRGRGRGRRPDPADFLPDDPRHHGGAWLALLRAEMGLRWEAGDRPRADDYRDRCADLGDEALVALAYEEFCLREEAGERPDPAEYEARFPRCADRLRRVLEIHDLIGSTCSTPIHVPGAPGVPFPEAGQTIAGFHLVEELGRGSFARVFLARERQLADRPVALKVARAGSREPQTLARLQHTHIVPVHSYRTDPATGLHLLCMPYLGRVTLAQILADERVRVTRSGADLVAALDRLEPGDIAPTGRAAGRLALAERPYARAIAWWGARLAEALQYAHERGVMHRDVKPSNVLVTGDGMPMLLDFNLAWEPRLDDPALEPATLGGTLAYMAPEHLLALAEGRSGGAGVDGRADVYALGVVLYEAMGARPFAPPEGALGVMDTLLRAADQRRAGAPAIREQFPEVPPALAAVIHKCLAPEPGDRYASAADLAADLQAVADDAPLRLARTPLPDRVGRWVRRHRRPLAVAAALALAVAATARVEARRGLARRAAEVRARLAEADRSFARGELALAQAQFAWAAEHAGEGPDPTLQDLWLRARSKYRLTAEATQVRRLADALHAQAEPLRSLLLGRGGGPDAAAPGLRRALGPFYVLENPRWADRSELTLLDEPRRARLLDDVNELLFLWALASQDAANPTSSRESLALCDRALRFARPLGPWTALRTRGSARVEGREPDPIDDGGRDPSAETSALACLQWALLLQLDDHGDRAVGWLRRATEIEPLQYWSRYRLAGLHLGAGRAADALEQFAIAASLRPDDPEARLGHARAALLLGRPDSALSDLEAAARHVGADPLLLVRVAFAYASCLRAYPDRLPRVAALARRAWLAERTADKSIPRDARRGRS
jgi:serine/threonine protein kinase